MILFVVCCSSLYRSFQVSFANGMNNDRASERRQKKLLLLPLFKKHFAG
jgi:hypothetical protein